MCKNVHAKMLTPKHLKDIPHRYYLIKFILNEKTTNVNHPIDDYVQDKCNSHCPIFIALPYVKRIFLVPKTR